MMKQQAVPSFDQAHVNFTVHPIFVDEARVEQEIRFNHYFRRDLIDVRLSIKQDFCLRVDTFGNLGNRVDPLNRKEDEK